MSNWPLLMQRPFLCKYIKMNNKSLEKIPECIKILEYLLKLSKIRDEMENPNQVGDDIWVHQLKTCISILKDE